MTPHGPLEVITRFTTLLDRHQIERRVHVDIPGVNTGLWVTSPEVQVLRKLSWF